MIKKSLLVLASCVMLNAQGGNEFNMQDSNRFDEICIAGLGDYIKTLDDPQFLGEWYLYNYQNSKYHRVKNDEFEKGDAIDSAYKKLLEKQKDYSSIIGKKSVLNLNFQFKNYDFKKSNFPLDIMTDSTWVNHSGKNCKAKLTFDNINPKHAKLDMPKDKAKDFIKKRKRYGNVDRDLVARYSFTIVSSKAKITTSDPTYRWQDIEGSIVGHINKLEIVDKKGKILATYDDYK